LDNDKKSLFQGLTHFGNLLKKAIGSRQETMTEVELVKKNLNAIKKQSKKVQLEKSED